MFIGFTGQAFKLYELKELNIGDSMKIGHYDLKMVNLEQGENANYQWHRATVDVFKDGRELGLLQPEKRFYPASRQSTSEVGIRVRPNEDVYLNFGAMSDDNQRAVIQAYINPLVSWVWVGGLVLIGGTLICLVPAKIKMQYARTQVVGVTSKHATVSK
jgi:cytochrome c-type biogenesis protein CcmF